MDTIQTSLSRVDGTGGALLIRGVPVEEVALNGRVEDMLSRLWFDREPEGDEGLGAARVWAAGQLERVSDALTATDGMVALRGAVGLLEDPTDLQLVAAVGVFGAVWLRGVVVAPDPGLGHGSDLLRMAVGESKPERGVAFGRYLCTVADHGTNASTFAARVVASTGSDSVSSAVAALGALKGPLHGGAPGPVLDMLDAIGTAELAESWVRSELDAGRRIMGMGHRVYRARDPRAAVLERAARDIGPAGRLALAKAVETAAVRVLAERYPKRSLKANVEFATAVLLEALGLPRRGFTVAFAMGRILGWLAHVHEQRQTGRLIRPMAEYVGKQPGAYSAAG